MKKFTFLIAAFTFAAGVYAQNIAPIQDASSVKINKDQINTKASECAQEGEDFQWILGNLGDFMFADDIVVSANTTFSLEAVAAYYGLNSGGSLTEVNFDIFTDVGGAPGASLGGVTASVTHMTVLPEAIPGVDVGVINFTFDTPIELAGGASGARYWFGVIAPNGSEAGMVTSNAQSFGGEFVLNYQGDWIVGSEAYDFEGQTFDLAIDFYGTCDGGTSGLSKDVINAINIYPNPAKNVVTISAEGVEGTISVVSITGQEVINTVVNGTTSVNVSNLTNGVYIYTIRDNNNEVIKTNKLVIQK